MLVPKSVQSDGPHTACGGLHGAGDCSGEGLGRDCNSHRCDTNTPKTALPEVRYYIPLLLSRLRYCTTPSMLPFQTHISSRRWVCAQRALYDYLEMVSQPVKASWLPPLSRYRHRSSRCFTRWIRRILSHPKVFDTQARPTLAACVPLQCARVLSAAEQRTSSRKLTPKLVSPLTPKQEDPTAILYLLPQPSLLQPCSMQTETL